MSCDCREFSELILDLAYDELGEADASRLLGHAASCPACRAELDRILLTRKIAAQLPAEAPAPSLREAVIALAREAPRAAGAIAPAEEAGPGPLERLRAALLRPAFATALAASAVLAISLYLYRGAAQDRAPDAAAPGAPFLGPVGAPSPAAPAAAGDVAAEREKAGQGEGAAAQGVASAPGGETRSLGTGKAGSPPKSSLATAGPVPGELAEAEAEVDPDARARREAPAAAAGGGRTASGGDELDDLAPGGGTAGKAKKADSAGGEAGSGGAAFDAAMGAYDRGDCATATPLFARVADDPDAPRNLVPEALHHLARCARRSGSCGRAVAYYERLLADWPGYRKRPEALWEAASCYRRLGQTQQALALLDQLEGVPGWGDRTRAERSSIERSAAAQ